MPQNKTAQVTDIRAVSVTLTIVGQGRRREAAQQVILNPTPREGFGAERTADICEDTTGPVLARRCSWVINYRLQDVTLKTHAELGYI